MTNVMWVMGFNCAFAWFLFACSPVELIILVSSFFRLVLKIVDPRFPPPPPPPLAIMARSPCHEAINFWGGRVGEGSDQSVSYSRLKSLKSVRKL